MKIQGMEVKGSGVGQGRDSTVMEECIKLLKKLEKRLHQTE